MTTAIETDKLNMALLDAEYFNSNRDNHAFIPTTPFRKNLKRNEKKSKSSMAKYGCLSMNFTSYKKHNDFTYKPK